MSSGDNLPLLMRQVEERSKVMKQVDIYFIQREIKRASASLEEGEIKKALDYLESALWRTKQVLKEEENTANENHLS